MYFDLEMRHQYITIVSKECSVNMFPSIMKWSEGIYIAILSELDLYFEKNFPNQDLETSLRSYLSDFIDLDTPIVYGKNPARVLLATYSMQEKNMSGVVDIENKLSTRLIAEASWDIWWRLCDEYEQHRFNMMRKTDKRYRTNRDKLKKSVLDKFCCQNNQLL